MTPTLIFDRKDAVLAAGYQAMMETPILADRVYFTLEEFKSTCEDLDVLGFFTDKPVGMVIFKNNNVHITILKDYRGKCNRAILAALNYGLTKYQHLIGSVHKDNKIAIKFVHKLGFQLASQEKDMLIYTIGNKNVF